jgi:hypothetical protein
VKFAQVQSRHVSSPVMARRRVRLFPFFRSPKRGMERRETPRDWRGPFSGACEAPLCAHGHSRLPGVTASGRTRPMTQAAAPPGAPPQTSPRGLRRLACPARIVGAPYRLCRPDVPRRRPDIEVGNMDYIPAELDVSRYLFLPRPAARSAYSSPNSRNSRRICSGILAAPGAARERSRGASLSSR